MSDETMLFNLISNSKTIKPNNEEFKGLFRNQSAFGSKRNSTVMSSTENLDYSAKRAKEVALSFQIMTCAEPPELVIETINSLLAIKGAKDEILIIDNNNQKRHLYQPLADYCNQLSSELKVNFYHVDKIEGYKAGALNLALQLMDTNCTHIVVVDSDYQALPHARTAIARAIAHYPQHSLLQFPQFYRSSGQQEVHSELNHYFNHHLFRSFNSDKALSTGTYAVIKVSDLIKLGGWSSDSITEDAQMGVNMHRSGLYTHFIPEVISTGLLPNTFKDLISQRKRWIYGNMQVLTGYLDSSSAVTTTAATGRNQTIAERLGYLRAHLSQLTAWVNFTAPLILLHLFSLVVIAASAILPNFVAVNSSTMHLLLFTVYGGYSLFALRRLWAYFQDKTPLNKQLNSQKKFSVNGRLRTWLMHLNFWELGAMCWLPVLWGKNKPFTCTPKQKLLDSNTNVLIKNFRVAPKLLILLNLATAVMVSPLTVFYSPYLFVAAISFLLLKIGAIIVATDNFTEDDEVIEANEQSVADPSTLLAVPSQPLINKISYSATDVKSTAPKTSINQTKVDKGPKNCKRSRLAAVNSEDFVTKPQNQRLDNRLNQ